MIRKRRIILSSLLLPTLLLTWLASVNWEPNDQKPFAEILQRIASAEREVSYVGKRISISWAPSGCYAHEELVLHQPPSIHFVKVLTPPRENRRFARFEELRRRREEVRRNIRRGNPPAHEPPHRRRPEGPFFSEQWQQRIGLMTQKDIERLSQNYTLEYVLSEGVAGYDTNLLTIAPRFEGRSTKRIWISREQGIILRIEDLDAKGHLRFLSVYTQMSFQPEDVQREISAFQEDTSSPTGAPQSTETVSLEAAKAAFNQQLLLPDHLPEGFELQNITLMKLRPEPTVHLRYTDGLMVLSLFEESKGKRFFERRRRGPRGGQTEHIHGTPVQIMARQQIHILRWFQGDVGLTLIGEVSRSEMIQIAESLIRSSVVAKQ
ncbi:MAG: hypothetical protein O7E52_26345 [Candidatus Poribacteria bacterium]|nr:hypothetical protein [Candidatus Poribacteria bacterium]